MLHRAGAAQLARMAQAGLLHACPPALRVLEDGQALVAAAVQTEAGISIAVARFDAAGAAVMESTALGPVSDRVVEGALLLAPAHAHADGVHAAGFHLLLRLEDGSLLRLDEQGSLTPTIFEAPPVTPLTMELGSHGAYVLACDPRLGPFMAEA
jgi:hypothetical protein